jgi:hypothetical protein
MVEFLSAVFLLVTLTFLSFVDPAGFVLRSPAPFEWLMAILVLAFVLPSMVRLADRPPPAYVSELQDRLPELIEEILRHEAAYHRMPRELRAKLIREAPPEEYLRRMTEHWLSDPREPALSRVLSRWAKTLSEWVPESEEEYLALQETARRLDNLARTLL